MADVPLSAILGGGTSALTVTALSIAAGVVNTDLSLGDYFSLTLTENVTSITFTNLPATSMAQTVMVRFTQGATPFTVAWPVSFKWAGGTAGAVSTSANAIDILALTSFDQGTRWEATLSKAHS